MDRQNIIEGLRHCSTDTPASCEGCPYNGIESHDCITHLIADALEMILTEGER